MKLSRRQLRSLINEAMLNEANDSRVMQHHLEVALNSMSKALGIARQENRSDVVPQITHIQDLLLDLEKEYRL